MSEARTPGTCTIRSGWAQGHPFPQTTEVEERYAEFDRWFDRERAAARREGQAEAWDEGAEACSLNIEYATGPKDEITNPYRNGADQ